MNVGKQRATRVARSQDTPHRLSAVRVQVNRIDELRVWKALRELGDRRTNAFEAGAEILPTMAGDQYERSGPIAARGSRLKVGRQPIDHRRHLMKFLERQEQRINDRIARHENE